MSEPHDGNRLLTPEDFARIAREIEEESGKDLGLGADDSEYQAQMQRAVKAAENTETPGDTFSDQEITDPGAGLEALMALSRKKLRKDIYAEIEGRAGGLKKRYEEARTEYLSYANYSEGDMSETAKMKREYLIALKDYVSAAHLVLTKEFPVGEDGTRGVEYENQVDKLFKETFWTDAREQSVEEHGAERKVWVGAHIDMVRELVRDQEMFSLFANRIPEASAGKAQMLIFALRDAPIDRRISGDIDSNLEAAKKTYAETRFAYFNAYYDWLVGRSDKDLEALRKASQKNKKAREKIAREFNRKPGASEEGMDASKKQLILKLFYLDELAHTNKIRESLLSASRKKALSAVKKRPGALRNIVTAVTFALGMSVATDISNGPQFPTHQIDSEDEEQGDDSVAGESEQIAEESVDGPPEDAASQDSITPEEASTDGSGDELAGAPELGVDGTTSLEGPVILEQKVSADVTVAIEGLLNQSQEVPWFSDWVESVYADADPVDLKTPEGRAGVVAHALSLFVEAPDAGPNPYIEYHADIEGATIAVNSGAVVLVYPDGERDELLRLRADNTVNVLGYDGEYTKQKTR